MHTAPTLKNGMHHVHDGSVKAVHFVGHLLHEKSFWGILALIALFAALLTLAALFGNDATMKNYHIPYGPYY